MRRGVGDGLCHFFSCVCPVVTACMPERLQEVLTTGTNFIDGKSICRVYLVYSTQGNGNGAHEAWCLDPGNMLPLTAPLAQQPRIACNFNLRNRP